jgi:hypothetical protein
MAGVKVVPCIVLWDLACLINMAALVIAVAVFVKVAKLVAVLA